MQFLKRVIVFAAKHVQQCALCSQKGFLCEICNSDKVIYPFDVELTVRVSMVHWINIKVTLFQIKKTEKGKVHQLDVGK